MVLMYASTCYSDLLFFFEESLGFSFVRSTMTMSSRAIFRELFISPLHSSSSFILEYGIL